MGNLAPSRPEFDSRTMLLKDLNSLRKMVGLGLETIAKRSVRLADEQAGRSTLSKATLSRFLRGESASERHLGPFVTICIDHAAATRTALPPGWDDFDWWLRRWAAVGPGSELSLESQDATWEGDALGLPYGFPGVPPTALWGDAGSAAHQLVDRMRSAGRGDDPVGAVELAGELQRRHPDGRAHWAARQAVAYWAAEAGRLKLARRLTRELLSGAHEEFGAQHPFTRLTARRLADREADLGNHRAAVLGFERELLRSPEDESRPDQLLARLGWARSMTERGHLFTAFDALGRLLPVARRAFGARHPVRLRAESELLRVRSVLPDAVRPGPGEYLKLREAFVAVFGEEHRYTFQFRGAVAEQFAHIAVREGDKERVRAQRGAVLDLWERSRHKRAGHPVTLTLGLLGAELSLLDQDLLDRDDERLPGRTQALSLCEEVVACRGQTLNVALPLRRVDLGE